MHRRFLATCLRTLIDAEAFQHARTLWLGNAIAIGSSDAEQRSFLTQYSLISLDERFIDTRPLLEAFSTGDADALTNALKQVPPQQLQVSSRALCERALQTGEYPRLGALRILAPTLALQIKILFGAQEAWNTQGEHKSDLQRIVDALYAQKVVTRKAVERWLEDNSGVVPRKEEALFDVSPWWTNKMLEEKSEAAKAKAQQNAQ